jgi:hypothetical protein
MSGGVAAKPDISPAPQPLATGFTTGFSTTGTSSSTPQEARMAKGMPGPVTG